MHSNSFVIYYQMMLHGSTIKVCSRFCLALYHYTIYNDFTWYYICSTWFLDIRISTSLWCTVTEKIVWVKTNWLDQYWMNIGPGGPIVATKLV